MSYSTDPDRGPEHDGEIAARVQAMIEDEAQLAITSLNVDCRGGIVHLTGEAATQSDVDRAAMCAQGPPGVLKVINEIVVRSRLLSGPSSVDRAPDGWRENS